MVGCRAEVGLFQGGLLAFQAGDENAVIQTDAADVGAFETAHAQDLTVKGGLRIGAVQQPQEFIGLVHNHFEACASRAIDKLLHGALAQQLALADDHEAVCGELHFRKQVGGNQHGAAGLGEFADTGTHPVHAFGVEAVDGLVKKQVLRLADERTSKAQALLHA